MFRLNAVASFLVTIGRGGKKTCRVRFPSDSEWCERMRKVRIFRSPAGRDRFTSDITGQQEADADLFTKIRIEDEQHQDVFDTAEASAVITKLDSCRVIEGVRQEGDRFKILLDTPEGETSVLLSSPSERQAMELDRRSSRTYSGRRTSEWQSLLEPYGELFDAVFISSENYLGSVPVIHKWAAIRELIEQTEEAIGEGITIPEG